MTTTGSEIVYHERKVVSNACCKDTVDRLKVGSSDGPTCDQKLLGHEHCGNMKSSVYLLFTQVNV